MKRILVAVAAIAMVWLGAPAGARAAGEEQVDRFFVAPGLGFLAPMSGDFASDFRASFQFHVDAGFMFGAGPRGFVVAPAATFKYVALSDDLDFPGLQTHALELQVLGGVKLGWAGKGLFIYGQADFGLNDLQLRFCSTVFGGCQHASETDPMVRFGGGADFSVLSFLAVGGLLAYQVVFSNDSNDDGYTYDAGAFELVAYAKFVLPDKPMR